MTQRTAELAMVLLMGVFSIYLMIKSAELPVGWIEDEGPGGGAWPFWLSAVMLISCLGILSNWLRRKGPVATSDQMFVSLPVLIDVGLVAGALILTVALFSVIGVYGSLPLFLLFYLKVMGRHSWLLSIGLALFIPIFTFFFFEITLKIILPKGLTEELFYPLYRIFL